MTPFPKKGRLLVPILTVFFASLWSPSGIAMPDADGVLEALPPELSRSLLQRGWLVLQEVDEEQAGLTGGYILAYVIFERPHDEVWDLLVQTERQVEFRSELRRVERIRELPAGPVDEHRIKMMLFKVVYRLRYDIDPAASRIHWELDPEFDNDLDRAEGFWELHPMRDGRTLARFGTVVDVGAALPTAIQDMVTRSKVPKTLEACREWVGAGGQM
jgi:hypothetical protein